MKNLKIGAKILFGFGMIILMVVIITVVISVSNNTITKNTMKVEVYSEISGAVTETFDSFYSTYLSATSYSMRHSVEAWNSYVSGFSNTANLSRNASSIISRNPLLSGYAASWDQAITQLNDYNASMEQVNGALIRAQNAKNVLDEIGPEIIVAVNTMYDAQVNTTRGQINNGDPPEELNIKMDRINDTVQINNRVTIMRIEVARLIENYSTDLVSDIVSSIDSVYEVLAEYMGILRTQTSLDIAQNALDKLEAFESAVLAFIQEQDIVSNGLAAATRIGTQILSSLNEKTNAFEQDLTAAIQATASASQTAQLAVLVVAGIAITLSVTIALSIKNAITKPVLFVSDIAAKIANDGELELSADETAALSKYSSGGDETAHTVANFGKLIDRLKTINGCLAQIARNDLTAIITPLGDNDAMGNALQSMLQTLNSMFSNINISSVQVSSGSKQVADGAQALAQGATEQAASIEQLASSIADIAISTRENATLASDAAKLANQIIGSAEKGSSQMADMIAAVNEINEASNSIGKVIKVIDDIAFQTNILALNAAVEAARAGQHGKGFAVVAEEVRSLAAKSAEAAKNTGSLIESSMEKALLGVRIAGETAESLTEIVSGISESNQLVDKIAKSSEQQSVGIDQINIGVDQVAQVVQQNSATAQESAAASQEMSSQSTMLQELISQFKLINQNSVFHSLPSPSQIPVVQRSLTGSTLSPENEDFGKY